MSTATDITVETILDTAVRNATGLIRSGYTMLADIRMQEAIVVADRVIAGDIGAPVREVEFEPLDNPNVPEPDHTPVTAPETTPELVPA